MNPTGFVAALPNYTTDLNHMHDAEAFLKGRALHVYMSFLNLKNRDGIMFRASARDRAVSFCEMLIQMKGKL